jgi:hypothetical protein
MMGKIIN